MATFRSAWDSRGNYRLRLDLTEDEQSEELNRSKLDYLLYLEASFSGGTFHQWAVIANLTINGSVLWNTTTDQNPSSAWTNIVLLRSGSINVNHDPDGSKTVAFSAAYRTVSQEHNYLPRQMNLSGTMPLTPIPRGFGQRWDGTQGLPQEWHRWDGTQPVAQEGFRWDGTQEVPLG